MHPGLTRLGGKAITKQYLLHKAVQRVTLATKGKPARRRRTGPY